MSYVDIFVNVYTDDHAEVVPAGTPIIIDVGIRTDIDNEETFLWAAADELERVAILQNRRVKDKQAGACLQLLLQECLPLIVDISCRLRGYKANVYEETTISAGGYLPRAREIPNPKDGSAPSPEVVATTGSIAEAPTKPIAATDSTKQEQAA